MAPTTAAVRLGARCFFPMEARIALHADDDLERLALVRAFESAPPTWDVFLWSGSEQYDVLVSASMNDRRSVAFDPADPDRAVSDVADVLMAARRRVTVVTGARRGCGVSTLALHMSAALAVEKDVCLVDLDPESALRARLGLPEDTRDWGRLDDGVFSAAVPLAGGFRVMFAPRDRDGDAGRVLRASSQRFDHVVVDAPVGCWRDVALDSASGAVLVVPPSPQGVAHARDVLERHPRVPWCCVINRLGAGGGWTARRVARELGHPVSLELPCSAFLRDREDDHRLLTQRWSRYFRRTSRLAATVV